MLRCGGSLRENGLGPKEDRRLLEHNRQDSSSKANGGWLRFIWQYPKPIGAHASAERGIYSIGFGSFSERIRRILKDCRYTMQAGIGIRQIAVHTLPVTVSRYPHRFTQSGLRSMCVVNSVGIAGYHPVATDWTLGNRGRLTSFGSGTKKATRLSTRRVFVGGSVFLILRSDHSPADVVNLDLSHLIIDKEHGG